MVYRDSLHIEAPVSKVFSLFRDPGNFAQAVPEEIEFTDVVLTDEGVGTRYSWATTIAGLPFRGTDTYTEFEPNRLITDRSSSALEGTWTYTFEPEGTGTRLTVENRSRSIWNVPPLRQLLDRATAKAHRPRFERAKEQLEQ
jgi:ligand-binding SRPBCC domain-containing protein